VHGVDGGQNLVAARRDPGPRGGESLADEPVALGETRAEKDALVGSSRVMENVYKEIGRIAATPVNALVTELMANTVSSRTGCPNSMLAVP